VKVRGAAAGAAKEFQPPQLCPEMYEHLPTLPVAVLEETVAQLRRRLEVTGKTGVEKSEGSAKAAEPEKEKYQWDFLLAEMVRSCSDTAWLN
jgi:ribosomal protein L7/L12